MRKYLDEIVLGLLFGCFAVFAQFVNQPTTTLPVYLMIFLGTSVVFGLFVRFKGVVHSTKTMFANRENYQEPESIIGWVIGKLSSPSAKFPPGTLVIIRKDMKDPEIQKLSMTGWRGRVLFTKAGVVTVKFDSNFVQKWPPAQLEQMIVWHRSFSHFQAPEDVLETWTNSGSCCKDDSSWVFQIYQSLFERFWHFPCQVRVLESLDVPGTAPGMILTIVGVGRFTGSEAFLNAEINGARQEVCPAFLELLEEDGMARNLWKHYLEFS